MLSNRWWHVSIHDATLFIRMLCCSLFSCYVACFIQTHLRLSCNCVWDQREQSIRTWVATVYEHLNHHTTVWPHHQIYTIYRVVIMKKCPASDVDSQPSGLDVCHVDTLNVIDIICFRYINHHSETSHEKVCIQHTSSWPPIRLYVMTLWYTWLLRWCMSWGW